MSKDDGGSAFPEPLSSQCGGMSLRDYLAAKAMQGLMTDIDWHSSLVELARYSYKAADAMLAARNE